MGSWLPLGGTNYTQDCLPCMSIPKLLGGVVNMVGWTNEPSPSCERDRAWLDTSRAAVELFWLSVFVFIAARG